MMTETTTILIFGASGDLSQRKLIPALFNLYRKERLPANFHIVGTATRPWDDAIFRATMLTAIDSFAEYTYEKSQWEEFAGHLFYQPANINEPADFERLAKFLFKIEDGTANRLYYLATAPEYFFSIIEAIRQAGLTPEKEGWRRAVIEKPFGTDLATARILNRGIHRVLSERQIYRIDHYLGKETVQNLMVFRFANGIFEPLWNRNYIDHVQISVAEEVGIGHRGGYYDEIGVLRDMFQNHLMQLLTLVAMEPPATFESEALRDEKVKVLNSLRPITDKEVNQSAVQGQYLGYRDEAKVAPNSQTATYAAVRLFIDNWRWQDVPFYLRSGKRLAEKCTEVIIQFKCPPRRMFPLAADQKMNANVLALNIQPDEGIHLRVEAKVPDTIAEMRSVNMEFHYDDTFGPAAIPEAYERLLLDALHGDASLFIRADQAELAWEFIDPIIAGLDAPNSPPLASYEPGSWGPIEANHFIDADGRAWLHCRSGHELQKD